MAIPVQDNGGDFQRELPPEGRYNAVCVDVVDLGLVEQKAFAGGTEKVHMVRIVWALGDARGNVLRNSEKGWPLTVSQRYRSSLHEKANLRKMLQQWLTGGHAFTDAQLSALKADIEKPLLGRPAEVKVIHSKDGKYANIDWVEPHAELQKMGAVVMPIPTDYTRVKDREQQQPARQPAQQYAPVPEHARQAPPSDDPFGAPAQQHAAHVAHNRSEAQRDYDTFQAPPMDDEDEFPLPF